MPEPKKEGDEGKGKVTGEQEKIVTDLKEQITAQGKMLEEMKTANGELITQMKKDREVFSDQGYLDYLEKIEKGEVAGKGAAEETKDEEALSAMSRSELATHISKGVTESLSGVMKEMATNTDKQIDSMLKTVGLLGNKVDVEFTKLKSPKFAEIVGTDEGKETFIKIGEENPTWGAGRIYEEMEKNEIVSEKRDADQKAEQAEEEAKTWSEKPGAAASIAEEKDLSDDEIVGKAVDAVLGTNPHALEGDPVGVVTDK